MPIMAISPKEFQERLAALRASYGQKLPEQLREFEALADALIKGGTSQQINRAVADIHAMAHRLSGSSGTFGFVLLSEAAHQLEIFSGSLLENGKVLSTGQRQEFEQLLFNLMNAER